MTERQMYPAIKSLFQSAGGIVWKIPDDRLGISAKKPFDGFGVLFGKPLYFEVKLVKTKRLCLAPSKIKPHQKEALQKIKEFLPYSLCGFVVGHHPSPRARVKYYWRPIETDVFIDFAEFLSGNSLN